MGFEPTRAEPIGLAVQCLNHSAIPTLYVINQFQSYLPTCAARVCRDGASRQHGSKVGLLWDTHFFYKNFKILVHFFPTPHFLVC